MAAFNTMERALFQNHTTQLQQIDPPLKKHSSSRYQKIYRDGSFNPDDLLKLLFHGQIPHTSDRKYPF